MSLDSYYCSLHLSYILDVETLLLIMISACFVLVIFGNHIHFNDIPFTVCHQIFQNNKNSLR